MPAEPGRPDDAYDDAHHDAHDDARRDAYDEIVLCDLDGVVWLSGDPIDGAVAAIERLRAGGRRVLFVTNSSAPTIAEHTAALAAIGVDADGDVVSSSTAAGSLLRPGERVLVCGGAGIAEAVTDAGAIVVDGADDAGAAAGVDAVVVGLHLTFDYHRLRLATEAIRGGARFIATNQDPLFPTPDGPIPGAGSIVAAVAAASGVRPETAGKPHEPMAAVVARLVDGDSGPARPRRMVMVGDMPSTDGAFAAVLHCPFALVRSGNTAPGAVVDPPPSFDATDLAAVAELLLSSVASQPGD